MGLVSMYPASRWSVAPGHHGGRTEDAHKEMGKALQATPEAIEDAGNVIEMVTPDTGKTMDGISIGPTDQDKVPSAPTPSVTAARRGSTRHRRQSLGDREEVPA